MHEASHPLGTSGGDPGPSDDERGRRDAFGASLAIGLTVLVVEYGFLALRYDGLLHAREGWWSHLSGLVTAVALTVTAAFVVRGRELASALREAALQGPMRPRWRFVPVQLGCYGLVVLTAEHMRRLGPNDQTFSVWAAVLTACALATAGSAVVAFVAWHVLRAIAPKVIRALVLGAALGLTAWLFGLLTQSLWDPLRGPTLTVVVALIDSVAVGAEVGIDGRSLGLDGFWINIAPECAGYEGIGLITVFSVVHLWVLRQELRFPRALVLPLVAVGLVWSANAVRLAALVLVGARYSADVALGAFHSKAGWILFCFIALVLVVASRRFAYFNARDPLEDGIGEHDNSTARYLLPLVLLLATSLGLGALAAQPKLLYGLPVAVACVGLWWSRHELRSAGWRAPWPSVLVGLGVLALWLLLLPTSTDEDLRATVSALSGNQRVLWLVARVAGSVVVIPVVEELAFRGYLMRRFVSADFHATDPRQTTWLALVLSSLAFAAVHGAWVAAFFAGLAYGLWYRRTGRLADSMTAHAVTNAGLSIGVLVFDQWYLW